MNRKLIILTVIVLFCACEKKTYSDVEKFAVMNGIGLPQDESMTSVDFAGRLLPVYYGREDSIVAGQYMQWKDQKLPELQINILSEKSLRVEPGIYRIILGSNDFLIVAFSHRRAKAIDRGYDLYMRCKQLYIKTQIGFVEISEISTLKHKIEDTLC